MTETTSTDDLARAGAPESAPLDPAKSRPRPSGRRRIVSFLAGFLVVVVGAEMAVRVVHNHLPPPHRYISVPAETLVLSMNTLKAHGIRSDVTFVGTSMVKHGIDANLFERIMPGVHWAHNVAIAGAQADVVRKWLLDQVMPRLEPHRVVWGISSLDFNSGRLAHPIDQYENARATEPGFYGALDRIMWNSTISLYRDSLRDPYAIYQSLRGKTSTLRDNRGLQVLATPAMAWPYRTPAQLARYRKSHFKYTRDTQLRDFRVGKEQIAAYRGVMETLRRDHVPLVIVIMPVPTLYFRAHPHGVADYDKWRTLVESVAASEHVTVLDESRAMPDSAFRDTEHLDLAPARQFTRILAARLRAMGW